MQLAYLIKDSKTTEVHTPGNTKEQQQQQQRSTINDYLYVTPGLRSVISKSANVNYMDCSLVKILKTFFPSVISV
jgi:hypothetical protein